MSTSLSVGKDTNKRAKIQIIFEIFQAEVFSALVKYTKYLLTTKKTHKNSRNVPKKNKRPREEPAFSEAFAFCMPGTHVSLKVVGDINGLTGGGEGYFRTGA